MQYRFELWRRFAPGPTICFVLLNCSDADDTNNDPTIELCQRRAAQMGFGRLLAVNLFAFRATKPADMKAATDPVGPGNDEAIKRNVLSADMVVCAWGAHGSFRNRSAEVTRMLLNLGITLYCLALTQDGEPRHPLMIGYDKQPFVWKKGPHHG